MKQEIARTLHRLLSMALAAHDARARQPHSGVYHFKAQNDDLGLIRLMTDMYLSAAGLWPAGSRSLGNDAVLALLEGVAE